MNNQSQIQNLKIQLSIDEWTTRAKKHASIVSPAADGFLTRRKFGKTHAVHDFLFTYYGCSPAKLKQWIPSFEQEIEINDQILEEYPWLNDYWFIKNEDNLCLNRERIQSTVKGLASFVATLCTNIAQRPPRFGCFGLHEWAMVYKTPSEELRHNGHKLRLSTNELAAFVESQTLCCSHYDAFRFFTKEAHTLNTMNPRIETRLDLEQGGCVHVNMDLYKWSTKLWPWIGSDFMAKAFQLAFEARELDMRASPYDLTAEGYSPICIEIEEGRKQYQREQQALAEKSMPLREELRSFCERLSI